MSRKTNNTKLPSIKKLPSGNSHCRVYSHKDENGKLIYESFTNPDYNKLVLEIAEFKNDRKQAKTDRQKNKMTLKEACHKYIELKSNVLSPSTIRSYVSMADKTMPRLMAMQMSEITQEDIQREMNEQSKYRSPKTVRNYHGFVTTVIYTYIPSAKFNTTLPQKEKPDIVIPTEEEIKLIMNEAKDTVSELPIVLAACCGMRASEISGLKWSCVDLKNNVITIREAKVKNQDNELVSKKTKTTAGKRTIRIFPIVKTVLEKTERDGDYVVSLSPVAIGKRFTRILEKCNVGHFRFHDLRHYCVSVMLSLNIPKSYIAAYVGHETENMIDKVYGHIMASKKTSVEDQLQQYFEEIFSK